MGHESGVCKAFGNLRTAGKKLERADANVQIQVFGKLLLNFEAANQTRRVDLTISCPR
jgi:hypothetical protein